MLRLSPHGAIAGPHVPDYTRSPAACQAGRPWVSLKSTGAIRNADLQSRRDRQRSKAQCLAVFATESNAFDGHSEPACRPLTRQQRRP
jgi:hypothetical protein